MKRGSKGFFIAKIIVFILFVIYALSILYPFFWAIMSSLKEQMEYQLDNFALPKAALEGLSNYVRAWKQLSAGGKSMATMFLNSVWFTFGSSFLAIATSVCTAYVGAKYKFPGSKALGVISICVMLIPVYGNLSATYVQYSDLNLYDSPLMLISYASGFGFNYVILYSFFKSIPWDYAEAAFIDGASNFKTFISVMLPMAISPITALFVTTCVGQWNDYMTPILFLPSHYTIPAGLYIYQIESERMLDYPLLFAGVLISMVPILILFIVMQDKLMELSIGGGIKG